MNQINIIGISGGSGSGKTHCANRLNKTINLMFGEGTSMIISQDRFYHSLDDSVDVKNYNFDSPDAIDFCKMEEHIQKIIHEREALLPIYNFTTHTVDNYEKIEIKDNLRILIIEGILIFTDCSLLDMIDIKVFIDTDDDIRLKR